MLKPNSLLLYKNRPARLLREGDRLEIELESGETARVRLKDIVLLHPGPLNSFKELSPQKGEIHEAWEILAGEQTSLAELAELIYGAYSPATAWATWQQVSEGLYFAGSTDAIRARSAEDVARRKLERDQAQAHQRAWQAFLQRVRQGAVIPADREFLREVETLALGRGQRSMLLRELGRAESPDNAQALLLELKVWDEQVNPYPARLGVVLQQPEHPVPDVPGEDRRDLTHLQAFAIDDEDTDTPDDALSFEPGPAGGRLWVHVADVAALVTPGSALDEEARARGESLHLPEGTIHLLPRLVTERLGLGLNDLSPALSFGIDLNEAGQVTGFEIVPSLTRVTRMTYAEAEQVVETEPLHTLEQLTSAVRERRRASGAVMLDFPEVKMSVQNGQVAIHPLPALRSRAIVEESMILASTETARFARENGLGLPFSQQEPVETSERPNTLAEMFAFRRQLRRGQYRVTPGPHGGLGVPAYTQVTSPLRRYLDLVGHQQIRAFLAGAPLLDEAALLERIGAVEAIIGPLRQAELLSERHWTLVYLLQHPGWRGEGILVERRGATGIILIPALALEIRMHVPQTIPLDGLVPLTLTSLNLPQLEASFRVSA